MNKSTQPLEKVVPNTKSRKGCVKFFAPLFLKVDLKILKEYTLLILGICGNKTSNLKIRFLVFSKQNS